MGEWRGKLLRKETAQADLVLFSTFQKHSQNFSSTWTTMEVKSDVLSPLLYWPSKGLIMELFNKLRDDRMLLSIRCFWHRYNVFWPLPTSAKEWPGRADYSSLQWIWYVVEWSESGQIWDENVKLIAAIDLGLSWRKDASYTQCNGQGCNQTAPK